MFTSSAEVFRTRQAVRDLVEAVGVHREAVLRLGSTGAERDVIAHITASGCRIDTEDHRDVYSSILLAAAMPDDDFASFIGATALLLADRLQNAGGADDLYWNWDAFREHYRLADPPVRAALMNGFRLAADIGRVSLAHPPEDADCLTFQHGDVIATLQSVGLGDLCTAVRTDATPEAGGRLWHQARAGTLSWHALAGFRYLYERPGSMAPSNPETAPLIPWV